MVTTTQQPNKKNSKRLYRPQFSKSNRTFVVLFKALQSPYGKRRKHKRNQNRNLNKSSDDRAYIILSDRVA